jgi:hypothetical protein
MLELINFANQPVTIGELRTAKDDDASVWSPRDVLIHTLRLIDSGDIDPDQMVVMWSREERNEEGKLGFKSQFLSSAPSYSSLVGLVAVIQSKILAE